MNFSPYIAQTTSEFLRNCDVVNMIKTSSSNFQAFREYVNPAEMRDNKTLFHTACEKGRLQFVMDNIGDNRVDPSLYNNHSIVKASYYGHTEIVRLLLADPRVNPADNSNHAIAWASWQGHTETVRLLLADPRVDPAGYRNEPIERAAEFGHIGIVELLLNDYRIDVAKVANALIGLALENSC